MGDPQNGWFTTENPIRMDDFLGVPPWLRTPPFLPAFALHDRAKSTAIWPFRSIWFVRNSFPQVDPASPAGAWNAKRKVWDASGNQGWKWEVHWIMLDQSLNSNQTSTLLLHISEFSVEHGPCIDDLAISKCSKQMQRHDAFWPKAPGREDVFCAPCTVPYYLCRERPGEPLGSRSIDEWRWMEQGGNAKMQTRGIPGPRPEVCWRATAHQCLAAMRR